MKIYREVDINEITPINIEWRSILGFEGYYEVSNTGLIRSLDRCVIDKRGSCKFYKGKVLKPYKNSSGYLNVCLKIRGNNISKTVLVHRMVAQSFIQNKENKETVNQACEFQI